MDDVFVGRIMSTPVETVRPDEPIRAAAMRMREEGIGSLVVIDDGELAGIVTATDFLAVTADGAHVGTTTVADYMSTDVETTTVNTTVEEVADEIVDHAFHHLPVVDGDGGVVGMVTTTDLAAYVAGSRGGDPRRSMVEG